MTFIFEGLHAQAWPHEGGAPHRVARRLASTHAAGHEHCGPRAREPGLRQGCEEGGCKGGLRQEDRDKKRDVRVTNQLIIFFKYTEKRLTRFKFIAGNIYSDW